MVWQIHTPSMLTCAPVLSGYTGFINLRRSCIMSLVAGDVCINVTSEGPPRQAAGRDRCSNPASIGNLFAHLADEACSRVLAGSSCKGRLPSDDTCQIRNVVANGPFLSFKYNMYTAAGYKSVTLSVSPRKCTLSGVYQSVCSSRVSFFLPSSIAHLPCVSS